MRDRARFLAGLPHRQLGAPGLPHPSARRSPPEGGERVRLACVRHAASVYPEPGSNSPSKWVYVSPFSSREGSSCPRGICLHQRRETRAGDRSCDPGQAVCYLCKTLGCSQITVILPRENGEMNQIDRNCMLACDVCGHRTCLL